MRLSPLNFSGLLATMGDASNLSDLAGVPRAEQVTLYRCLMCRDVYDDEDDATSCCFTAYADLSIAPVCPVCASDGWSDHRAASDCCLWKDLSAAERWRIADAVEAGATWLDALGVSNGQLVHRALTWPEGQ